MEYKVYPVAASSDTNALGAHTEREDFRCDDPCDGACKGGMGDWLAFPLCLETVYRGDILTPRISTQTQSPSIRPHDVPRTHADMRQ